MMNTKLLSLVIGKEVQSFDPRPVIDANDIRKPTYLMVVLKDDEDQHGINAPYSIHDLQYKTKLWAKENGFWIDSNLGFASIGKNGFAPVWKTFNGSDLKVDEPHLVFAAGNWILKYIEKMHKDLS